jgi:hypothetical protein
MEGRYIHTQTGQCWRAALHLHSMAGDMRVSIGCGISSGVVVTSFVEYEKMKMKMKMGISHGIEHARIVSHVGNHLYVYCISICI